MIDMIELEDSCRLAGDVVSLDWCLVCSLAGTN